MSNTSLPPVLPNDDNISLNVLILVTVACGQSTCQFVSWPLYRLTAVQFSRSFFQSFYSSFFALVSAGGWRLRTNCSRDVCPVLSLRSEVYLNHPRHSSSVCVFIFARGLRIVPHHPEPRRYSGLFGSLVPFFACCILGGYHCHIPRKSHHPGPLSYLAYPFSYVMFLNLTLNSFFPPCPRYDTASSSFPPDHSPSTVITFAKTSCDDLRSQKIRCMTLTRRYPEYTLISTFSIYSPFLKTIG